MIAKNIYYVRVKRGLTQTELARMLRVHQKDVSRWETGERIPSLETLVNLCNCLQVSSDFLLGLPVFGDDDLKKND